MRVYELVPDDFAVPAGLEHERFRLRMLTVDDVVKDFDAICNRVDHEGSPQPPFVETIAENLVDLGSALVEAALREWLEREWPFRSVDWGERT